MKRFVNLLPKYFQQPSPLIGAGIALSLVGILDAGYLSLHRWQGGAPNCSIIEGCDLVTTSTYATLFSVPVAYLGLLFYLTVFFLFVLYLDTKKTLLLHFLVPFTAIAVLMSVRFVYLQLFVIEAICLYCMISAALSLLLFIVSGFLRFISYPYEITS